MVRSKVTRPGANDTRHHSAKTSVSQKSSGGGSGSRPSWDFSKLSISAPAKRAPGGGALDAGTCSTFAAHFDHDFSGVRVHTDTQSAAQAKELHAQAFTVGQDVFFDAGQYSPHSPMGKHLLAHELAHVVQQRRGAAGSLDGGAAAEREADRAAFAVGAGGPAPSIRERAPGGPQLKSEGGVKLATPSADPEEATSSRITDAYGSGSLNEGQWNSKVEGARNATDQSVKEREYTLLFKDVAGLAQVTTVLENDAVNWLAGNPLTKMGYKPGLNLTPLGSSYLPGGGQGVTGFVNAKGEFAVVPSLEREGSDVQIAILMTVEDFDYGKEFALGVLRHEMLHAVHSREALLALIGFQTDRKKSRAKSDKDPPRVEFHSWVQEQQKRRFYSPTEAAVIEEIAAISTVAGHPNSEVLAHFEGFMTRFHLTKPPIEVTDPVFNALGGVLKKGDGEFPWRFADTEVRAEVLGRFRRYYVEALDKPHRDAFRAWVSFQMTNVKLDRALKGQQGGLPDDASLGESKIEMDARLGRMYARDDQMYAHFFVSLQTMLEQIDKPTTPMALRG